MRGLRRNERLAMLAAGAWFGIGMQGYTAYRFMIIVVPLLVLLWLGWQWWWQRRRDLAMQTVLNSVLALILAVLVMVPMLRYTVDEPDEVLYRSATRLSSVEQPIEGSAFEIFLNNVKNVLLMFNYTSDEVWVANLPGQPVMDSILGALLVVGAAAVVVISVRQRDPWPAALLLAGILMLLPSALSIAFPRENPSVVRTGGALPMLMIVCAAVPGLLLEAARSPRTTRFAVAGVALVGLIIGLVVPINADRVFAQYPAQYCPRAQNAADIARVMDKFVAEGHSRDNAWIVGYPHWVDSRAVGIWIGDITFPNTVMGAEEVAAVDLGGEPGWFVLNINDTESLQVLNRKYPQGSSQIYRASLCPDAQDKQFLVFETQP